MSVIGRLKGGIKTAAGSGWAVTKKLAVKIAIGVAIMVVAIALAENGEGSAAEATGARFGSPWSQPVTAQQAVLTEERAGEQLLLCKYTVKATFGVSIFTDTDMGANRIARLYNRTEVRGSCGTTEGGDTIGCGGLRWEKDWIRIRSGDTVGWAPASCLVKDGFL